jgi:hypothetical protein
MNHENRTLQKVLKSYFVDSIASLLEVHPEIENFVLYMWRHTDLFAN